MNCFNWWKIDPNSLESTYNKIIDIEEILIKDTWTDETILWLLEEIIEKNSLILWGINTKLTKHNKKLP